MNNKKVVAIGGGHGLSTILRALKQIDSIDISAIVTVADDGGSTGRLRRFYNIPAMGDIRNVLIALAESEPLIQQLMDYRFEGENEEDVKGHNLGNLILTALTNTSGSFVESVSLLAKVLNVKGKIIPASPEVITLFATMDDGTIVRGEANIPSIHNRIRRVYYDVPVEATEAAIEAIKEADLIIYGIGSVYTSILPSLIIKSMNEALKTTKALKVYVCNAMSQPGETDGYSMEDHVQALISHQVDVDQVIYAADEIPRYIIERYLSEGSTIVHKQKKEHPYKVSDYQLLSFDNEVVRHHPDKLKACFIELLKELPCHLQPK